MKKVVGIVVALLVLAYPAATWWTGKQVEAHMAEQYKMVEQMPFMKIVKRDFQRGFASSTETVTFELFGDMFRSLGKLESNAAPGAQTPAAGAAPQPVQFTVRSNIKHGPFAGGKLAAAVAETELVFDDKTKHELAKVFGDKKPLTARTVFAFGGGGSSTVESPPIAHTFTDEGGGTLTWGGVKADMDFAPQMRSYTLRGAAPKLEVKDNKGGHMVMSDMQFTGDQKRVFDDEPMLYAGTQNFKIAQIEFSGMPSGAAALTEGQDAADAVPQAPAKPVSIKNVTYDISMPINGEFLDMGAKLGAASVLVDKQDYGPVHYDLSFKRLHARTTAKLYRAMMKMYSDPAAMTQNPNPGEMLAPLAEPAMELLKYNPEFAIDRISFKSPQGEARVSGHVKLKDAKPEDLANPMMMLAKLDAGADLELPEAFLAEIGAAKAQSPEEKQMQQQMFAAQLEALSGEGYVTRANGLLKAKIAFQSGQLTVNGKPFNPMAMGGGAGMGPGGPEQAMEMEGMPPDGVPGEAPQIPADEAQSPGRN